MDRTNANEENGNAKEKPFQRKLTAILSVDVQGYSRMMDRDEAQTVRTIKTYRQILRQVITTNQGRVIDSPGDNLLAEFASVLNAVQSALKIQSEIKQQNLKLPENRQMLFRIGVNLGDVIVDGRRIYGDGVNIAARMESLAQGGGVCISGGVYDQIQNKMAFGCAYLGRQTVKNIKIPVRVYEVWEDPDARECRARFDPKQWIIQKPKLLAGVAGLVLIVCGALWLMVAASRPPKVGSAVSQTPITFQRTDKPSIAVLPFVDLGTDDRTNYLADGLTNDIITDLSRFRGLAVAASNSVYRFKGKAVDVQEVGRQLKVAYLLEGSVQVGGDRIRINAQLIDTSNGKHIWADRYNRKSGDILSLQQAIIETIVRKLSLNIDQIERSRAQSKKTENLNAYENYLKGYHHLYQRTRNSFKTARISFKRAIEIDPDFGAAYMGLASVRILDAAYGYTEFPDVAMQEAETLLKKALVLDEFSAEARAKLGYIYMRRGAYNLAMSEINRALELNPNDWRNYRVLAPVLLYSGHPQESLKWYLASFKHNPYQTAGQYMNIGICYYLQDDHEEAIRWLDKGVGKWPDFLGNHLVLASIYAHIDLMDKAAEQVEHIRRIAPFFELSFYGAAFQNPQHRRRLVEGLRKAGLS